jgi:hypothetical protein
MAVWDEAKHKRFHGKFVGMGLGLSDLKRKHNIALVKQPNQGTHHVYHDHNPIGMISPKRDGSYEARVMRKPGTVEKVSDHPFRSKAEAAAAIAAVHPGVKSIRHEPLGYRGHR